ncbi:phosphoribosyltransferase [Mycobacterium sp. MBM]|nr:phosphoribosyltransferase [Mycobacterium sp. MBM]
MGETVRTFANRREAGQVLASALCVHRFGTGTVVLGLARGGVPVGWEVAAALGLPFEVFLVRKLGVPDWPELAMGALASGGTVVRNDDLIESQAVTEDEVRRTIAAEREELRRRTAAYGVTDSLDLSDRTVILVDDGIATGASMLAAIRAVRVAGAARVVVAVPVAAPQACRVIGREADELVCVSSPPGFRAVGAAYTDFAQTGDDEVRALLALRR